MKKLIVGLTVGMMLGSAATAFAAEDIGKEIKAVFAKFNFKINGVETPLETSPLVYEGTAYLPVREVGKLTGYTVSYKEDTQTIELTNVTNTTYALPVKTETAKPQDPVTEKPQSPEAEKTANADTQLNEDYYFSLMDLTEVLEKKNYRVGGGGGLGDKTTILINDKEYKLTTVIANGHINVDISPLIDAKLITLEEAKTLSEEVRKEREKAQDLGIDWEKDVNKAHLVQFHDLYGAIAKKYKSNTGIDLEGSWTYHNGYEGRIKFNGKEYKLKAGPKEIVDMTPLIEANVITLEEVKNFKKK
ncbi:stalk domain-containing protein [Paenibacillus ehimensis]|uniref:Stalk domain-containing protein n=1 Tax=Paenibacillus ehimensis TaxID=79264 RepID=A0ABT8V540_9BACL|nr:stalk domain-containing protein [Paenibacillus ehimensis]MDO3676557.1 stalk domain-containing protein [Paenibacillus ehimensis]